MENKPNYYSIIPANIRYDNDLKANEKLLYGEITALANKEGYCWASNNYFAELYDVSRRSIINWINHLEKRGYIYKEIDKSKGNKRKIYITPPSEENFNRGSEENFNRGSEENFNRGKSPTSRQNRKEEEKKSSNNTRSNNTRINEEEEEKKSTENENLNLKTHKLFEQVLGTKLKDFQEKQLLSFNFPEELIQQAIKITANHNGKSFMYLFRVLNEFKQKNINNINDLEKDREKQNKKKKNKKKYSRSSANTSKKHKELHDIDNLKAKGWN